MTLEKSLTTVRGLTHDLSRALTEERLDQCLELLAQRAEALQRFEALHRQADAGEKRRVGDLVRQLQAEDRALQALLATAMDATGSLLQRTMSGNGPQGQVGPDQGHTPGTFDRKA